MNKAILAAVAGIMMFTACNQSPTGDNSSTSKSFENSSNVSLAYINLDTLQVQYLFYKRKADQLKKEIKDADSIVTMRQIGVQKNYDILEKMAPSMSPQELEKHSADFERRRQEAMYIQQQLEQDITDKQQLIFEDLQVEIDSVLNIIKQDRKIDFIFTYPRGSGLLSVNEEFDITNEVTKKLNEWHEVSEAEQGKGK